ncbi:ribonuclease E/G [Pedomonas mirosovicensis]|uniref:ribonuclease E/G n=1 Tax=Pedomonas mirosovicensis TaxID=2908641 RepID=UPI002169DD73|nr:ribonuclease E/G [Pedomonas mirosovicensis]MCH8683982.1 ribonuclease E/G [Pedomonas mirosovicensis]
MPGEWLIEALPGERRAVLVEGDTLLELRLIRDETDPVQTGAVFGARLRRKAGPNRAVVDLGAGVGGGVEAYLQPVPPALSEGQLLAVEITRPALPEPGKMKPAHARPALGATASAPGLITPAPEWVPSGAPVRRVERLPAELGVDEALDAAVSGEVSFPGGLLTLERTRAGLVIDVDGTGRALDINVAAAKAVARLLRLYAIGGPVMIDFLGSDAKADRVAVAEAFDAVAKADPTPFERTAINGYGLMQVIRPRPGPSVIDLLCGMRRNQWAAESLALRLMREAVLARGAGVRRIHAPPEVAAELSRWPDLLARAEVAAGARIEVLAEAGLPGYGHVHVQPV